MLKILLIEDEFIVQHVQSLLMKKLGCEVDIVNCGEKGLEKIKQGNRYNLIFTDLGLPDYSGPELIKKLIALQPEDDETPIIALTGFILTEDKQDCLEAGAKDIACKPISKEELKELLDKYAKTIT